MTVKQLEWTESVMGGESELYAAAHWNPDGEEEEEASPPSPVSRAERRAEKAAVQREAAAAEEAADLDRVLARIASEGMDALSPRERRILDEASRRRQKED